MPDDRQIIVNTDPGLAGCMSVCLAFMAMATLVTLAFLWFLFLPMTGALYLMGWLK